MYRGITEAPSKHHRGTIEASPRHWQAPMFYGMATYIYAVNDELRFCADAVIDFAKSSFGGRGGRHGDILWDNESTAIKHFLTEFARLAQTAIEKVAQWFVWICKQVGQLNDCELRRRCQVVPGVSTWHQSLDTLSKLEDALGINLIATSR